MGDLVQYAAITDLERVMRELSAQTGKPVVAVFDPARGWFVSDEVTRKGSKHGASDPIYEAQAYHDWCKPTIAEAAMVVFGVRFLPGTLIGKLFRKPAPTPTPRAIEGDAKDLGGIRPRERERR